MVSVPSSNTADIMFILQPAFVEECSTAHHHSLIDEYWLRTPVVASSLTFRNPGENDNIGAGPARQDPTDCAYIPPDNGQPFRFSAAAFFQFSRTLLHSAAPLSVCQLMLYSEDDCNQHREATGAWLCGVRAPPTDHSLIPGPLNVPCYSDWKPVIRIFAVF